MQNNYRKNTKKWFVFEILKSSLYIYCYDEDYFSQILSDLGVSLRLRSFLLTAAFSMKIGLSLDFMPWTKKSFSLQEVSNLYAKVCNN